MTLNVYIGYDEREHIAAEVCKFSIEARSHPLIKVNYLRSKDIVEFKREREPHQATDFTYTRFLVPFLNNYEGISVFCDCDFLFQCNIEDLYYLNRLSTKAVWVVKHPQYLPLSNIKMDDIPQHAMPRKNWASLVVFNNSHPACKRLTPEYVNTVMPGRRLHTFDWVDDNDIGSLPMEWNTLDGYYHLEKPRAIHYTEGGPWFDKYKNTFYSEHWWKEYNDYINASGQQRTLSKDT